MYKSRRIIAFLLSLMLIVLTSAACVNKDEHAYTKADLEAMDAHELYELLTKNGLEAGADIKEILSDKKFLLDPKCSSSIEFLFVSHLL